MGKQVYIIEQDVIEKLLNDIKDIKFHLIHSKPQDTVEKSISHKEAADFLNIHRNTLTERITHGIYPKNIVHMNGKKKEYYKSQLQAEVLNKKPKA